jgi:O-antigen biosynthesis protein
MAQMKYNVQIDLDTNTATTLVLRNVHPNTAVLEFGPATGYMTHYMKEELGCAVCCVEFDPQAAEVASQYCDKMLVADIEDLTWLEYYKYETFDHILFADVLEHLRDPELVLRESLQLLKPNGTIITSIPNIGHSAIIMELLQGEFHYRSLGLLDNTHIRFFTRKSMLSLFDKAGLYPQKLLTSLLDPSLTEFKQAYASFPWYVESLLRDRQDAHVYHFITILKRFRDVAGEEVSEELSGVDLGYAQLFWDDGIGYTEESSCKHSVSNDKGYHTYTMRIPSRREAKLRFDPVNMPSYVEIEKILVRDPEGNNHLVVFPGTEGSCPIQAGGGTIVTKTWPTYQFVCTTGDPSLFFFLSLVFKNKPIIIDVTMRIGSGIEAVSALENRIQELEMKFEKTLIEKVKQVLLKKD